MFFFSPTGLGIEQTMLKNLKELSDGEIKVAISTVNMTLEVRVGKLFWQWRILHNCILSNWNCSLYCIVSVSLLLQILPYDIFD